MASHTRNDIHALIAESLTSRYFLHVEVACLHCMSRCLSFAIRYHTARVASYGHATCICIVVLGLQFSA
jgi:hypothetical protein